MHWRGILCLGLAGLLAGCATAPSVPGSVAEPPRNAAPMRDEAAVAALYDRIGVATSDFQAGLELIRAGSPADGRSRLEAALADLEAASFECGRTPGCDTETFVGALLVLVRLQGVAVGWIDGYEDSTDELVEGTLLAGRGYALPQVERSLRLLRGRDLGELINLNQPVRASLQEWLTWMRPMLIETWVNYQYLRNDMYPAYQQAGLPEALLFAILAKESIGRVHAFSRAGAAGPLQFMPATGRRFGLGSDNGFDQRLDPAAAARANVAYIEEQLRTFNDDLELTLAAYNGGEGRMGRLAKANPGRGFWSDRIFFALPSETRDYVPKVLAAAYLFLHPEEFGLEFPPIENDIANVELDAARSINEIAMCLGQKHRPEGWFRTLRNLNPRHPPNERLPAGSSLRLPTKLLAEYSTRCRDQELMTLFASLQDAHGPGRPAGSSRGSAGQVPYVVRRGDTLAAIARRTRCSSVGEIARLNGIQAPKYALRVGQQLRLPTCS